MKTLFKYWTKTWNQIMLQFQFNYKYVNFNCNYYLYDKLINTNHHGYLQKLNTSINYKINHNVTSLKNQVCFYDCFWANQLAINPKEEKYILSKKIIKLIKSDQRKIRNKKSSKISQWRWSFFIKGCMWIYAHFFDAWKEINTSLMSPLFGCSRIPWCTWLKLSIFVGRLYT